MSEKAITSNVSIFKVEFTVVEETPYPSVRYPGEPHRHTINRTLWVLVDGDAADAIAVVKVEHPDATVHVVRRHASGASVLVDSGRNRASNDA